MSNSLPLKCGVNLPYLMYQEALHGPLLGLENPKQNYPDNVLWWFLAEDIASVIRHKTFLKPLECIKCMIGSGYVVEPMYWRDPYPGIRSVIGMCLMGLKKISRKENGPNLQTSRLLMAGLATVLRGMPEETNGY